MFRKEEGKTYMNESITKNKVIFAMAGILVVGSMAALIQAYHDSKHIEQSFESVIEQIDEDIFV